MEDNHQDSGNRDENNLNGDEQPSNDLPSSAPVEAPLEHDDVLQDADEDELDEDESTDDDEEEDSTAAEVKQQTLCEKYPHGCKHYRRRCKLRAPCCGEVFWCRHCHNEVHMEQEKDPKKQHELNRHLVESVICALCDFEQKPGKTCERCQTVLGEYFCEICRFYDDDISKDIYHCERCRICRVGGHDNFFHCDRCASCYPLSLQGNHQCIEQSMHQNCPVCMEFLFTSRKTVSVMRCGHTIHSHCLRDLMRSQYTCPLCSQSLCDMSRLFRHIDTEIANTPMPEEYRNLRVPILCNDCHERSETAFHVVALKCGLCNSYNTRRT
eukprot:GILK01003176.1.p1 GENE.GILK01003176.1~~GILK01003176.1.p1  ORF type:complete len:353 (-),score=12.22 GILK01003176.1:222-1196(-)